jgi:hypothetical protein
MARSRNRMRLGNGDNPKTHDTASQASNAINNRLPCAMLSAFVVHVVIGFEFFKENPLIVFI